MKMTTTDSVEDDSKNVLEMRYQTTVVTITHFLYLYEIQNTSPKVHSNLSLMLEYF
jgi:hypothetical protein